MYNICVSFSTRYLCWFQVLTNHYERCGSYYSGGKAVGQGGATEEERRLTMMLFSGIFDSLAQRVCCLLIFHFYKHKDKNNTMHSD